MKVNDYKCYIGDTYNVTISLIPEGTFQDVIEILQNYLPNYGNSYYKITNENDITLAAGNLTRTTGTLYAMGDVVSWNVCPGGVLKIHEV